MFTTPFWRATLERAVRTLAQTLVALLTTSASGLLDVLLGSLAADPVGDDEDA